MNTRTRLKFVIQVIDVTDPANPIEGEKYQSVVEYGQRPVQLSDEQLTTWRWESNNAAVHVLSKAMRTIATDYLSGVTDTPSVTL